MDYKNINDYELLYMICDSDDSLDLLLDKYKPFINQKLIKYADYFKKYGIDLEDLRQEVYLSIISAINNYDEKNNATFYTYLNILIERKIANFWRSQFSAKNSFVINSIPLSAPVNDNLTIGDIVSDDSDMTENIVLERKIVEEVYNFCFALSLDDAFVFELYINGYSREIISTLLNLPYKKISYLLSKNKRKLKNYLQKKELFVL